MITNNLGKRIENINYYLEMSERLEGIIDDSEILEKISSAVQILKDSREKYGFEIKQQQREIRSMIEENQLIGNLANDYHNGDFKKAKNMLDDLDSNLKKYFFLSLGGACNSAFLCVITFPFSRKVSKIHYNIFKSYRNSAMSIKESIGFKKENKKRRKEIDEIKARNLVMRINRLEDIEFVEAKLADMLIEIGVKDKTACYIAKEQPEIVDFLYLEALRNKYGKGIV